LTRIVGYLFFLPKIQRFITLINMRKIFCSLMVLLVTLTMTFSNGARAEMPAKAKAFLTMAGYGAGGGALLGAASLAFGASPRAIAQGASLGLYAGIFFGAYILVSHHQKQYGNYEDNSSPYQESTDIYGEEYQDGEGGGGDGPSDGSFFERFRVIQEKFNGEAFSLGGKKRGSSMPPLQINIIQYNF
jgi:hypothetical protein